MHTQTIYVEFGRRLTSLRRQYGLSQAELANKLHMPQSTYANYETGKRKITLELIMQFSQFYSVSPTFLVTGQEQFDSDISISLPEIEMIKKYRTLNERGKEAVDILLSQPRTSVVLIVQPEKTKSK